MGITTVEILTASPDGSDPNVLVGQFTLDRDHVIAKPEAGYELYMERMLARPVELPRGAGMVTAVSAPEQWLQALPYQYSGTRTRARILGNTQKYATYKPPGTVVAMAASQLGTWKSKNREIHRLAELLATGNAISDQDMGEIQKLMKKRSSITNQEWMGLGGWAGLGWVRRIQRKEVEKFNPNHDERGRFSSGTSGDGESVTLYRGEGATIDQKGNFYSTDRNFAREFTHGGLESEIRTVRVSNKDILDLREKTPFAGDETAMDEAIRQAKEQRVLGFYVDEGNRQPRSVFFLKPFAKGGPGSGNFGHEGRPGLVGGSGEGGGDSKPNIEVNSANSNYDSYARAVDTILSALPKQFKVAPAMVTVTDLAHSEVLGKGERKTVGIKGATDMDTGRVEIYARPTPNSPEPTHLSLALLPQTVVHEYGHVADARLGVMMHVEHASLSPAFRDAYVKDVSAASSASALKVRYGYIADSLQEVFAEAYTQHAIGKSFTGEYFKKDFSNCMRVVGDLFK